MAQRLRPRTLFFRVLALVAVLGLLLLGTIVLTQHTGAEMGERCVQGAFACKNAGFNDARCLMSGPEGVCTRLCDDDTPCPKGWRCEVAVWVTRAKPEDLRGRAERLCVPRP